MTLEKLITTFISSTSEDWRTISGGGYGSGPSYKDRFSFYENYKGNSGALVHDSFPNVACYKPDLSITIAWGMSTTRDEDDLVKEDWATGFPNPNPGIKNFLDFFYNNALVYRYSYVVVDGGRCYLTYPSFQKDGTLYLTEQECDFLRSFNRIFSSNNFDVYLGQTNIKVVTEDWDY